MTLCHRSFLYFYFLICKWGRAFLYFISQSCHEYQKGDKIYRTSCSVGNPQTLLCGWSKSQSFRMTGHWRSQWHLTDDRHSFQGSPRSWSISLSLSWAVELLEMEGSDFEVRSALLERHFPSRTIHCAVLELGCWDHLSIQNTLIWVWGRWPLKNYKHELISFLPDAERPDPHGFCIVFSS